MWLLAATSSVVFAAATRTVHEQPPSEMDRLMVFGFLAAFATLVVGLHVRQSRSALAAFAVCLTATAVYGFMQGAWPLGFVQGVWAATAFVRWWQGKKVPARVDALRRQIRVDESRMSRMFGA